MDAKSIFVSITLIILANGVVLSATLADIPSTLRSAAKLWQWATLLVAIGCLTYGADGFIAREAVVIVGNSFLIAALVLYYMALRRFHNLPRLALHSPVVIVAVVGMLAIAYFASVVPDTRMRLVLVAIIWSCIMSASIMVLIDRRYWAEYHSRSRGMMLALYCFSLLASLGRLSVYLSLDNVQQANIANNSHWMNSITPILMSVIPIMGTTAFLLMCSEQVKRRWQSAASRDYLTNLPNRRSLMEYGAKTMDAGDKGRQRAIAILDVDHFKSINDRFGHEAGDFVLQALAQRLKDSLEKDDFLARTGGEEFVIVFGEKNSRNPELAAERIRTGVATSHFTAEGAAIPVTISVGIVSPAAPARLDELLRQADKALYLAKESGRNRVATSV